MMDGMGDMLRYPWEVPPDHGQAIEVAEGVLWIRLPLPMALDHVNVYALDEGDSWSIVDTGIHSRRSVALWDQVLAGPLAGKPVGRVILTHHHPDHVGMAGWLMARFDAGLTATRTSWLMARMLILDEEERPTEQALKLWRAAGMDPDVYNARKDSRPFNFADTCHPLPVGYTRVKEGDTIRAGESRLGCTYRQRPRTRAHDPLEPRRQSGAGGRSDPALDQPEYRCLPY